ncbi:MAG: hypothetical protein D8M57_16070 [Candidatus Scalindua sp. AMX11]|nr:MAG: hypothetical protein DWQ00_03545 [Candidatus Scalindua sp.]TDE63850.1 MAG: hypothetical protein D8M57_16070 [Candidatus Scalindua sp. AMX11]
MGGNQMAKFIQLSDLHIRKSNGKEENGNCEKIVKHIINKYSDDKPVVLLTGDIVDDGRAEQYKNAVNILKPLVDNNFTVLASPGNHDYGPMGNFYTEVSQRNFQNYILCELLGNQEAQKAGVKMEDLYPMVTVVDDVIFIGIDSVVGAEDQFMHFASGEVGDEQREKLKDILRSQKDSGKKIVSFFHHHPFNRKFVLELDDSKEVMKILTGNVDVLCFGHDHKSEVWSSMHNIDWIFASGKSTRRNKNYKFQFREVAIDGDDNNVAMVTFKRD